jgi:hypothetical protein
MRIATESLPDPSKVSDLRGPERSGEVLGQSARDRALAPTSNASPKSLAVYAADVRRFRRWQAFSEPPGRPSAQESSEEISPAEVIESLLAESS